MSILKKISKRFAVFSCVVASFILIFAFMATGMDAAFAWNTPGAYGSPGYNVTQGSMVTLSSLGTTTASGYSYGVSTGSHSSTHWHIENTSGQSALYVMTVKLSDNLYNAMLAGKLSISVTATAQAKNENVAQSSDHKIKAFISVGNISGTGLARDNFTDVATATGNEHSVNRKNNSADLSSTASYSAAPSSGQYIRYGLSAYQKSTNTWGMNTSKAQLNNITMRITLSANGDSAGPTISGTNDAFTTSNTVTLTDADSNLWKYTINGGGGTTYAANTSTATITLSQGASTIVAYDNLGNTSTKIIKYYNPTVSIQSYLGGSINNNTTPGTIKIDNGTASYSASASGKTVGSYFDLVAVTNDGYYLSSWEKTTGTASTVRIRSNRYTIPQGDAYTASISWRAYFAAITTANKTVAYNGSAQGVDAPTLPSGYTYTVTYNGSATVPTNAGEYNVIVTIYYGSEVLGTKTVTFIINKAIPILDVQAGTSVVYGKKLSNINIVGTATLGSITVAGSFYWTNANTIPALNTNNYPMYFAPTDKNNYQESIPGSIAVTVTCGMTVLGVDSYDALGEHWQESINGATFNAAATVPIDGGLKAQVALTATTGTAQNYVFLGWQKNNVFESTSPSYTYTMQSDDASEVGAILKAVFVKIDIEGLVNVSYGNFRYDKMYSGVADSLNFTFSLPAELYRFNYTEMVYTQGGSFPVAIGTETATFSVTNIHLGVTVFNATIQINIIENVVAVAVDTSNSVGYNAASGWGETIYYKLSVPGVQRGSITKYQYRIDGESVWYDVYNAYSVAQTTVPQNENGCSVLFMAAIGAAGESRVVKYYFKAVNNTHGTNPAYYNGNKSVASTAAYTACKTDSMLPNIYMQVTTSDGLDYTGGWTNKDIIFTFTASFGGSGAQINYSNNGTSYQNTGATPGYNTGDQNIITTDGQFVWVVSAEQKSITFYFNITTGTNKTVSIQETVMLKVDKTKPAISEAILNIAPNINGWVGQVASASFSASEGTGWSGVASISVSPNVALIVNDGQGIDNVTNSCKLTVADYREYVVTVTDHAGNAQTRTLRYKVDTRQPALSVEIDGSYTVDTWYNDVAYFNLLAEMGASGAKFFYKFGADDFTLVGDNLFLYENDGSLAFQNVRTLFSYSQAINKSLYFRVETGAGHSATYTFGAVKLDYTKPEIAAITDMSYYQGSRWFDEPARIEFSVRDDASGVNITRVTVDNGGTVMPDGQTIEGYKKFVFQIDKCTVYTVTAYDEAGNSQTLQFEAKIDIGIPQMDYDAYIGNTGEAYYFNKWINRSVYGDNAYVKFYFYMVISPSGAKMQYMDASNEWKDLTPLMWQEGNENALIQHVQCQIDVKTDQNGPYKIRLVTGSGKHTDTRDLGTVRIDSTLPYFSAEPVFTDAADPAVFIDDFQTNWTYKVIKARFIPHDQTSGIDTVTVMRYEITDPDLTNGIPVLCQKEASTNYYSFLIERYSFYRLQIRDGAGNTTSYPLITAMVDTTDGFTLSVTATKDGVPYLSQNWLQAETDAVVFDLDISFGAEYTDFGASGGGIEFSVDGGNTWATSLTLPDGVQSLVINPSNPHKASMTAILQQQKTYTFRVRSGAGRVTTISPDFLIRKDIVPPQIAYTATVQGVPYTGGWTANDISFLFTVSVGASNGQIQMLISEAEVVDVGSVENGWTTIKTVQQGNNTTHTQVINTTVNGLYYYFRLVAGTGLKNTLAAYTLLTIDKDTISPEVIIYNGESVFAGGWASNSLRAVLGQLPNIISDFAVYYAITEVGVQVPVDGYNLLAGNEGIFACDLTSSERKDIRFKIVNGAGVEFVSPVKTYGIDLITPTFEINFNNEAPRMPDPENPNAIWYLSSVNARFASFIQGISGGTLQYAIKQNGEWGGWTAEGMDVDTIILRDTSTGGGTIIDIKFRVLSGAGLYQSKEYTAHIDDNIYEINLVQYVGSVEGLSYATDLTGITDKQRGGTVNISFKQDDGYTLKGIYVGGAYYARAGSDISGDTANMLGGSYNFDYNGISVELDGETLEIVVGGSDVEVYLYFIKDIVLKYSRLEQRIQSSTVRGIGIAVDEYNFDINYASEALTFAVSYNGSLNIPIAVGVYSIIVATANPNFNIINPDYYYEDGETKSLLLTVRYFEGEGNTDDPYIIYNYADLSYIDIYMDISAQYDYLGEQRLGAYFYINNDIELPSSFAPLCATEQNAFQGYLYGYNHKIFYKGTYNAEGGFGLLGYIVNGRVLGLGVEYGIKLSNKTAGVGLLAADATNAEIVSCYAYGNIEITGGTGIDAGGLVGRLHSGFLMYSFADVRITVKNAAGNFGGLAGILDADNVAVFAIAIYNFCVSQVVVDNSGINARLGNGYYAGAYIGYMLTPYPPEVIQEFELYKNHYLTNSVSYKDRLLSGEIGITINESRGIGNEGDMTYEYSQPQSYNAFLECEVYVGYEEGGSLEREEGLFVSYLARLRIRDAGFGESDGIEASPFVVDSEQKLRHTETFPWAYFLQTANLALEDNAKAIAVLIPFRGTLDGNGYEIRCENVQLGGNIGGLFGLVYGGRLYNLKILGISFTAALTSDLYMGGAVGIATANAVLDNLLVSGNIKIDAGMHSAYIGGVVGTLTASVITDCVSMVNITLTNAASAYVGGVIAQAQNAVAISNIVSLSKIDVGFAKNGYVGSSIGNTHDASVVGEKVYNVEGSTYVNGRIYDVSIGANNGSVTEIYKRSYNDTVSAAGGVIVGQTQLLALISGLYPFDGGVGTLTDPFRVSNYKQLLKIGSYMYANFVITKDIVIGDVDGDANGNGVADGKETGGVATPDGKLDEMDGYDFSFKSLGKGGAFTGSISGGYHSISGLTEPLFETNNGSISYLTLNMSYRQYSSSDSVPVGVQGAKVDASGKDIVFGGAAKYNYPNGKINSVTVGGTVIINAVGKAKVKAGGVVGIAYGGNMIGCLNAVDMTINALVIDAGGIVGSLEGSTVILDSHSGGFYFNHNYTLASIKANGGSIKAGLIVGAIRYQNVTVTAESADTSARVYINGTDKGSEWLIGYDIN